MKSQSWKKLYIPKIKTKSKKSISLKGEKTIISPKSKEDILNDFEWRTDPELSDLDATLPMNLSFEQFERISVNDLAKSSPWSEKFSIYSFGNEHIGNCMFYDINRWDKSCEFGIMIGNKNYWSGGFGTDATKSLIYYIFTETDLTNIYLHTLTNNIRAQKSFKKAGFIEPEKKKKGKYEFFKMTTTRDYWIEKFSNLEIKITPEEEQD
jgi:ribosomal-protein-alanine N-acetyltransferase